MKKVKVLVAQSCPTLYDPMDYSLVHGIPQARILEWVAIPFARGSSLPRDQTWVSDASPSEPPGKPTGKEGISFLQVLQPGQGHKQQLPRWRGGKKPGIYGSLESASKVAWDTSSGFKTWEQQTKGPNLQKGDNCDT